ncbi:serine/threonine-protein kinase [Polyangium sorediatum]|uniref:Serine/threonine-protein kinase n=1 Tax=Polyangium sorediatum TaxID=889274 RepID=A0ABT6NPT9_9BACT|nr:serine/threonine-protein kinase [Polyangium sorediatum]MDI1430334.1 serine/threonine-protein kinase [Polyangium sorediatum]
MSSLGPGAVIAGKYRLIGLLGKGAMGEVWRAEHVTLGAPVAIKLIDVDLLGSNGANENSEIVQRFFREAKAAAALRTPHVVQIQDHGYDGALPYIAMEMLEGETLEQRIERVRVLPPLMITTIITHIARAVGKAHEAGIVHRDLKPSNVFLVRNDEDEIAKVLDFGIAKAIGGGVLGSQGGVSTRTGSVVGTPCYMSPEQALGNKTIDQRADLWALGVIAYECVTGIRPFDSEALGDLIVQICARPLPVPSAVAPVPDGFDHWFAKACSREPNERFQTAKELAESLRWILCPDQSGVWKLSQTHPSLPNIVMPHARVSAPGPEPSAFAKTSTPDPTTMTHRGLVSAVAPAQPAQKKTRPAVIVGAIAALVIGAATVGVLLSTKGPFATTDATDPSASPPSASPAAPPPAESVAAPTTASAAPEPAPSPSPSSTVSPTSEPAAATPSTAPTPSAAPSTTTRYPINKGGTTTKKSGTTKKPNWGI